MHYQIASFYEWWLRSWMQWMAFHEDSRYIYIFVLSSKIHLCTHWQKLTFALYHFATMVLNGCKLLWDYCYILCLNIWVFCLVNQGSVVVNAYNCVCKNLLSSEMWRWWDWSISNYTLNIIFTSGMQMMKRHFTLQPAMVMQIWLNTWLVSIEAALSYEIIR